MNGQDNIKMKRTARTKVTYRLSDVVLEAIAAEAAAKGLTGPAIVEMHLRRAYGIIAPDAAQVAAKTRAARGPK